MLACAPACSLGGPVSEPLLRAPHPNPSSGCEGQPFPAAGPQGGHQFQRQAPVKGGVVLASGARPRQVGRGRAATRGCEGLRWHVVLRSGRAASSDVHSGAKEGTISRAERDGQKWRARKSLPILPCPALGSAAPLASPLQVPNGEQSDVTAAASAARVDVDPELERKVRKEDGVVKPLPSHCSS